MNGRWQRGLGRRSVRLHHHDYGQAGANFVTICAHDRRPIFGTLVDGGIVPTDLGRLVETCWAAIPDHFPGVDLDAYVVMPNHLHGILVLGTDPDLQSDPAATRDGAGTACRAPTPLPTPGPAPLPAQTSPLAPHPLVGARHAVPAPPGAAFPTVERFGKPVKGSVPTIVRSFKAAVTREANRFGLCPGTLWQRNFHEHVIRDDAALDRIRRYIAANPARWDTDDENPTPSKSAR